MQFFFLKSHVVFSILHMSTALMTETGDSLSVVERFLITLESR